MVENQRFIDSDIQKQEVRLQIYIICVLVLRIIKMVK